MEDCGVFFAYFNRHRFLGLRVLTFGDVAKATFTEERLYPVAGPEQGAREYRKVICGRCRERKGGFKNNIVFSQEPVKSTYDRKTMQLRHTGEDQTFPNAR